MGAELVLGKQVIWSEQAPASLREKHGAGPFEVVGADYNVSQDNPPLSIRTPAADDRIKVNWDWVEEA